MHLVRGRIVANGQALKAGDALKRSGETLLALTGGEAAEVLVFDLQP